MIGWSATKGACCRSDPTAGITLQLAVRSRCVNGRMAGSKFTIAISSSSGRRSSNGLVWSKQWPRRDRFLIGQRNQQSSILGNRRAFKACSRASKPRHNACHVSKESRAKAARHVRIDNPRPPLGSFTQAMLKEQNPPHLIGGSYSADCLGASPSPRSWVRVGRDPDAHSYCNSRAIRLAMKGTFSKR
jgi:hypothetical protein